MRHEQGGSVFFYEFKNSKFLGSFPANKCQDLESICRARGLVPGSGRCGSVTSVPNAGRQFSGDVGARVVESGPVPSMQVHGVRSYSMSQWDWNIWRTDRDPSLLSSSRCVCVSTPCLCSLAFPFWRGPMLRRPVTCGGQRSRFPTLSSGRAMHRQRNVSPGVASALPLRRLCAETALGTHQGPDFART